MKGFASRHRGGLLWTKNHERLRIVPWGKNGVRVRVTRQAGFRDLPQGLIKPPPSKARIRIDRTEAVLTNGEITVTLNPRAQLSFSRTSDDEVVLKECVKGTEEYHGRNLIPGNGTWRVEQRFLSRDAEKFYGLGQHQHGYLDQKGCVIDFLHRNKEVSIPFLVSSQGYGFLWNYPGLGRVELARNETRWVSERTEQIDYYVVVDKSPARILERYAEVTGFPTAFPKWASGFWQCKLRYKTQEELLSVAREYKKRKLPISVIVIDFHHWVHMGDWSFDPEFWPDPSGMVEELKRMGIELVVSVWPTVSATSKNYGPMEAQGLLVRNERGAPVQSGCGDSDGSRYVTFYDAMNPKARKFLWRKIRAGYVKHGITRFWLDTCEPEIIPLEQDNTRYYLGNGEGVAGLYPLLHARGFYEGLKSEGVSEPLTLGRSAWVGAQRYGAAVWSADIPSTFDSLRRQVTAGLNTAMSGIPWWTTDIGGFYGGDIDDPAFRELIVRWFQYGVFCPIFRLHGVRRQKGATRKLGGPIADPKHPNVANEVWSYGEEAYAILRQQLLLRERMRPYVMKQMAVAQRTGTPPMRPLFLDFPEDPRAWEVEDQFMFGPDVLVAPVVEAGQRKRAVYLPAGTQWEDAWSRRTHPGGKTTRAAAPIEHIPVYIRAGAKRPF
ncbi:TIM-barrel domain-containing protein [Planctomycetota bacterium]